MILKRKKKQEKKSKSKKEFKKEIIKNEETEDEFEKIDLGVWKKIFKILIKDKKIIGWEGKIVSNENKENSI